MKLILLVLFPLILSFALLSCDKDIKTETKNISCKTIDDCPTNYDCIDGFCKKDVIECISNADCPRAYYCNSEAKCQKKLCSSNNDCSKGKICVNQECIDGCIDNSDCNDGKICNTDINKCEKIQDCRINNQCEQGYNCDQLTGECIINSNCTTQEDCSEAYKCENSKCIARLACQTNDECENNEICKSNGYCGIDSGCDSNQYCIDKDPSKPACNFNSGVCYECVKNEDCNDEDKPFCNKTRHLCQATEGDDACMTDSDCGLNKKCNKDVSPHQCIDMLETCNSDSDCPSSKHCDTNNNICVMCLNDSHCTEPGSTCNTNTKICEGPCLGVFCSNHGQCVYDENNDSVSCDCDENYYADGLYCIYNTHNCSPDQLSDPLNASPETARLIDFGSYDNLTLGNSNCGYVEDWYKINLNANTQIDIKLTYTDTTRNISIKLYKGNNINIDNPIKSNTSPGDGVRSIVYDVVENDIYYIRILIYYTTEQKNISYSMTITEN